MEPRAARVMCSWVLAIHKYTVTHEAATPKRDKVLESFSKLDHSQKVRKTQHHSSAVLICTAGIEGEARSVGISRGKIGPVQQGL